MKRGILIKDTSAFLIIMIITIVIIGLMLACASGPQTRTVWSRPNATQNEFAKDKYDCMQQSQQRRSASTGAWCYGYYCDPGGSYSTVVTNPDLFNACMEARGWSSRKEKIQTD